MSMTSTDQQPTSAPLKRGSSTAAKTAIWAGAAVVCFAIAIGGLLLLPKAIGMGLSSAANGGADMVKNLVANVSDGFSHLTRAQITESFQTYVLGTFKAQRLNVATWKGIASLTKKEEHWPAAMSEVEVSIPVEAPLYVSLEKGKWDFIPKGDKLYVLCPELTVGKAAPEKLEVKKAVLSTSWRVSQSRLLEEAETELWQTLQRTVMLEAKKSREPAREGVAEFVRNWFMKAHPAGNAGKTLELQVIFGDEALPKEIEDAGLK